MSKQLEMSKKSSIKSSIKSSTADTEDDVNNLSNEDLFRLSDLLFNRKNYIYRHLYDSYNKFLDEDIKNFLENGEHVFTENMTQTIYFRYRFKYANVRVNEPVLENGIEPMFPSDARHNDLTYSIKIIADVTQYQDVIDIASDERKINQVGDTEVGVPLANIPLMLRSKWCSLMTHKGMDKNECEFDAGGYFIVNGNEKVVISQDRMVENKPLVFIKKDSGSISHVVQVNSRSYKPHGMTQVIHIKLKKDGIMIIRVPILSEINVCILFRALGFESDRDIIDYVTYDEQNTDMNDLLRITLDACKNEKGIKIQSQQDAIDYLIPKLRVLRRYTETDKEVKLMQKKRHLMNLLTNTFLPHVEGGLKEKGYYLGYMINRLLRVRLGRANVDDRDSYVNKRVDLPGDLLFELFKQQYKKMLGECKKSFDTRNKNNDKPINVIAYIKPTTIEQGLKAALSTGKWIRRQGVAQMLQRLTYLQTISFFRRIDAPSGDASSAKLMNPRHLHPSSIGFLCCVTGDTEILMGDNALVETIKNMKNGDHIMSVYTDNFKESSSEIKNFFYKDDEDIIKITTISGRELKCTLDHPILTQLPNGSFKMVDAGKLKMGDLVVVRHFQKHIACEDIDNNLEICARIFGYAIFGSFTLDHEFAFSFSNEQDLQEMINDLKTLGISSYKISRHYGSYFFEPLWTLEVKIDEFKIFIKSENTNDKTKNIKLTFEQYKFIPNFVRNGNLRIKREFLSGFCGGLSTNGKKFYCETDTENVISELTDDFGIDLFSGNYSEIVKSHDMVDFRYSSKNRELWAPTIEYSKYIDHHGGETKPELLTYEEFTEKFRCKKTFMIVPIESVVCVPTERVYDFETCSESHTLIANGFVTSNCIQTPEHAKIGLTKFLSMVGSITIMTRDQYSLLKDYIFKKVTKIGELNQTRLRDHNIYKVFLNGDWIGVTEKFNQLYDEMISMKLKGDFDQKNVSIVIDHEESEIRIYCDSGRLYRPVLRVENNVVKLKTQHLDTISLNKTDHINKITDWDEFVIKYNDVIEYIDMELQPYILISDKLDRIEIMRKKMIESVEKVKNIKSKHVDNRYGDMFYLKYTHCEIHPLLLLGEIVTNMPFCNHNDATRNIFAYSQYKHAMGIYATNYRDRLDTSFIMYYPQKRMVGTRTNKYVNTDILPSGENSIVAIASYTGYNQEDSLIFNKSSIERGKFMATYLRKYKLSIQKNQSTSQDDVFMKPDPTKVMNMRHEANAYNKLNDQGYVPEEVAVSTGDILLGKVTPNPNTSGMGKPFRDSSEAYKMHPDGVVDRVYVGIQNQDGYESRKMSVRSERKPNIGDKYTSCYDDQTDVLTYRGWVKFNELQNNDLVATLVNGNQMEYKPVLVIYTYDFNNHDQMYRVQTDQIDLMVTKNHNMWVKLENSEYKLIHAERIFNLTAQYHKSISSYDNKSRSNYYNISRDGRHFILPKHGMNSTKELDMNRWLNFLGIWYSTGYTHSNSVCFVILEERIKNYLTELCQKLGFNLICEDNIYEKYCIRDSQLAEYLNSYVDIVNNQFPKWIWGLTTEQCQSFVRGLCLEDQNSNNNWCYNTNFKNLADEFQRLCLHAGWACNINERDESKEFIIRRSYQMIVNKTMLNPIVNNMNKKDEKDDSYVNYNGKVYCCNVDSEGNGIIYVRRNGKSCWSGNSYGQKGTAGILLPAIDMPYTADGIRPDIIMNPNAIPSRMTIGQLIESLVGKVGALEGTDCDGTGFEEHDFEYVKNKLKEYGYDENGYEYLYNGMTGEKLKVQIFIGPVYYLRLKHLVADKIHCLTTDHEVLTNSGWKFYDQLTIDDQIATLKNDELVYEKPLNIFYYPNYDGDMYHIETDRIDLMTTMNHRMYVSKFDENKWTNFDFEYAGDIVGQQRRYKADAFYNGPIDQEKAQLLSKLTNQEIISFDDSQLADDMMISLLHCGMTSVKYHDENDKKYYVRIYTNKSNNLDVSKNNLNQKEEIIRNSHGSVFPVFCLEVSSGVFYVRRNGKPVWTGNSRHRGPKTLLTRQAPEGRSRDGGLRLGEMERDSIIAHGIAFFLKEKLLDNSDAYVTYVCDKCGLFAQRADKEGNRSYAMDTDIYFCPSCKNSNEISKVRIPYAFKLFCQELQSMSIVPRIRMKKN